MFTASLSRWNSLSNTCSLEGELHSWCHYCVFMFLISSSLSYQYRFCCSLAEMSSTSLRSNVCVREYVFIHPCVWYCCILFALSSYSSLCDSANTSALPTWCKVIKEHFQILSLTLSPFITPNLKRRPCYTSGLPLSFQHSCPPPSVTAEAQPLGRLF